MTFHQILLLSRFCINFFFIFILDKSYPVESLFIVSQNGNLIEYVLDPHVATGVEKPTDDSIIEVTATGKAQWSLSR